MKKFVQIKPDSETGAKWVAVAQIVSITVARRASGDLIVGLATSDGEQEDVTDQTLAKNVLKALDIEVPPAKK